MCFVPGYFQSVDCQTREHLITVVVPKQRGLMLRMRIIVLEIAANCVKFIRNAGKRVRAAVAQTGLSFIECSLFVSKRTAQNECKAGI